MNPPRLRLGPGVLGLLTLIAVALLASALEERRMPWEPRSAMFHPLPESAAAPVPGAGVHVQEGYVFTVSPEGLTVLDRSGLEALARLRVGGHHVTGAGPGRVLVVGERELTLVDVRDPKQPRAEARLEDGPVTGFGGATASDQDLYVAAGPLGVFRLVHEGDRLRVAEILEGPRDAQAVAVTGEDVLVADGASGLLVLMPNGRRGRLKLPGYARDVSAAGHYAAVALGSGGLAVADLTVRYEPKLMLLNEWAAPCLDVRYAEPLLAVGGWDQVGVWDFTIPGEPEFLAWRPQDAPVSAVALAGSDVVATGGEGTSRFRLRSGVRAPQIQAPSQVLVAGGAAEIPVTNVGRRDLRVQAAGEALLAVEPASVTVAPGATETLRATPLPGLKRTTVSLLHSAPDRPPLRVRLLAPDVEVAGLRLPLLGSGEWRPSTRRTVLWLYDPREPSPWMAELAGLQRLHQGESVEFVAVAVGGGESAVRRSALKYRLPVVVLDPRGRLRDLLEPAVGEAPRDWPRQFVQEEGRLVYASGRWEPDLLRRVLRGR